MKFFRFTLPKFIIGTILFAISSALSPLIYKVLVLDAHLRGLPLPFAFMKTSCYTGVAECSADFFWASFFVDMAFWYIVACFLLYLNELIKKG